MELKEWLDLLILEGPNFGYFPEPEKSYLVVHPDYVGEAKDFFKGYKINIVTGHRFLGGYVGSEADCQNWVEEKIEIWINSVHAMSKAAELQPQVAFVAFSKCLQAEWIFFCKELFLDLRTFLSL